LADVKTSSSQDKITVFNYALYRTTFYIYKFILFKPVNIEKSVFMLYINIIFCK